MLLVFNLIADWYEVTKLLQTLLPAASSDCVSTLFDASTCQPMLCQAFGQQAAATNSCRTAVV